MLGSDAGQIVQLRRQGGHGVAQRQRQEVLGVAPPRALVQRLALQPDAHEPAAMHGQGIEGGETLVEVGVAHGERGGRRHVLVAWPVQSSELMSLQITRLQIQKASEHSVYPRLFVWNLVERRRLYLQNPKGLIFPVFWLAGG